MGLRRGYGLQGVTGSGQGMTRRRFGALGLGAAGAAAVGLPLPARAAARTDVNIGVRLEPPHLDPTAGAAAAIGEIVYANVFEGLTRIDRNGAVQPCLATSWEIAPDGKTYTFKLRDNGLFHDGRVFNGEDVKFSLERARAADSVNPQKGLFEPIDTVEVLGPLVVKVTLKRPTGAFLTNMGWPAAVIVGRDSAAGNKTTPVGTGPFKFLSWSKGASIELVRNPAWTVKPIKLDRIVFKVIGDPSASFSAVMAGDVDAFPIYPAPENLETFRADPKLKVVVGNTEGKTILAMNNARKPFDDVRVRRALSMAVDRKAIIDGALYGIAKPIGSHFAPQDPGYVDLVGRYPYDPGQARALLKEAGVADGTRLKLVLPPPEYARRSGEIIASQLKKVGIATEIVPMEWAQWLSDVFKGRNYDLTVISHVEPLDIDIYARDDYYFGYANPAFKALIAELSATTDNAQRLELYGQAQRLLADDAVNVFLYLLPKTGVWNAKLTGLWENAPIPVNDLTDVGWEA